MTRRSAIVVLLSLLVLSAGCTALGSGDGGVPTTTSAGPAGGGAGDGGDVALVEDRAAELEAAGGYTAVWKMEFSTEGDVVGATTYTHAVDYGSERSSFSMLMTGDGEVSNDFETYHADGVTYARYGSGGDATYQANDATFAPENAPFPVESYVTDADDLADFSAVGTETFDGVTVTRYERTDRPNWVSARSADDEFTWTEFTYAVLVDGDGLVRSESWGGEGVDDDGVGHTMEFSYSLTGVGSTSVEEPDWIATAREQADQ